MSQAQSVASSVVGTTAPSLISTVALSSSDATRLKLALQADAEDYWYSGLISLGEATNGAATKRYSWATVKAYYAAYYFSRAILALNGSALWYFGRTPYSWEAQNGNVPTKLKGNTHDATLNLFDKSRVVPNLTAQSIGIDNATDWLIEQRTLANYKYSRFFDPNPTPCFHRISQLSLRNCIEAYATDHTLLYCFDRDHAILAFPIEMAKRLATSLKLGLKTTERSHLVKLYADSAGPYRFALQLFPA